MKTVHFHLGPHKTGSTAIQRVLSEQCDDILAQTGCLAVHNPLVLKCGKALTKGDFDAATPLLASLADSIRDTPHDHFVMSCEDFAGDLPGRGGKRRPYSHLWQNLNHIRKAFSGFDCRFYFFLRGTDDWLHSAYAQNVKYRSKFKSFQDFAGYVKTEDLWDGVLQRPRNRLGDALIEIPYRLNKKGSAITDLFAAIPCLSTYDVKELERRVENVSPTTSQITVLEIVNAAGSSKHAKRIGKLMIADTPPQTDPAGFEFPNWPPQTNAPDPLPDDLAALWRRNDTRVRSSEQPNLMPAADIDLTRLRLDIVDAPDDFPSGGRERMDNQVRILEYRFRGLPRTCYLLALTISYLRRDTEHTDHARHLFQRLWAEEYPILLAVLPTRWLISTFQTFMEHGANEAQRMTGTSAFFFCNLLKAYEAERALEGLPPNATYPNAEPKTPSGFAGLDRFKLGGTDLMLNTNAMLIEMAAREPVAGRVLMEFLMRMKTSGNVFTRMDHSRTAHKIEVPRFANCWSFFEKP